MGQYIKILSQTSSYDEEIYAKKKQQLNWIIQQRTYQTITGQKINYDLYDNTSNHKCALQRFIILNITAFIFLDFNPILNIFKINITLVKNGIPIKVNNKPIRLLICRYLNGLNPYIRGGQFRINPFTGELYFTSNHIFSQKQYYKMIKNVDLTMNYIMQVVESACDCVKKYIVRICQLAGLIDTSSLKNLMKQQNEQIRKMVDLQVKFHDLITKISRINILQYSFMYRDQLKKNSKISETERDNRIKSSRSYFNKYVDFRSKKEGRYLSISSNYSIIISDFEFIQYQQQWIKQYQENFIKYLTQINQNIKLLRLIYIYDIKNLSKSEIIGKSATCNVYVDKFSFKFISTRPENQKSEVNLRLQKLFVIKQGEVKFKKNTKNYHQKQIFSKIKDQSCVNIVKYYQTKQQQLDHALIMDYHTYTLSSYKTNHMMTMSLPNKIFLICQVIQGLRFLRDNKIVHLDMKSDNVLLSKGLTVKVTDFGQSYHPDICKQGFQPGFTFPYTSPEVFFDNPTYDQKSDVYSLGVMMYELFFQKYPIQLRQKSYEKLEKYYQINDKIITNQDACGLFGPQRVIRSLSNICLKCMNMDKNRRPYLDWILIQLRESLNYIARKLQ